MTTNEREHAASIDCWCHTVVLAYGDEPVYDDEGNLIGVERCDE